MSAEAPELLSADGINSPFLDALDWNVPPVTVSEQLFAVRGLLVQKYAGTLADKYPLSPDRLESLRELDIQPDEVDSLADVYHLDNIEALRKYLADRYDRLPQYVRDDLKDRNHEKERLYKMCLAAGWPHQYKAWLHDFKTRLTVGDKRAHGEAWHNHRTGFITIILSGWYEADELRSQRPEAFSDMYASAYGLDYWTAHQASLEERHMRYEPGDVYCMHPCESHRLTEVAEGTQTLLISLPPMRYDRTWSVEFGDTGRIAQRYVRDSTHHVKDARDKLD
jgi:hypothetical protein